MSQFNGKGMPRYDKELAIAKSQDTVGSGPLGIVGWRKTGKAEMKRLVQRGIITKEYAERRGVKFSKPKMEYGWEVVESTVIINGEAKTIQAQRKIPLCPAVVEAIEKSRLQKKIDELRAEKSKILDRIKVKELAKQYSTVPDNSAYKYKGNGNGL